LLGCAKARRIKHKIYLYNTSKGGEVSIVYCQTILLITHTGKTLPADDGVNVRVTLTS
jgi:hypothetical protein